MKINPISTLAFTVLPVAFAAITVMSCGTREKTTNINNDIDTVQYDLAAEECIEKDAPQHLVDTVKFDGKQFIIMVDRAPSDSLDMVEDENGPYLDNVVRITVLNEGETVIRRRFTKADFSEVGSNLPLSRLTLGGMGFSTINGSGIQFTAQLCSPGSLEGGSNFKVLFNLAGGNMRIEPDDTTEDHSSNDDE